MKALIHVTIIFLFFEMIQFYYVNLCKIKANHFMILHAENL